MKFIYSLFTFLCDSWRFAVMRYVVWLLVNCLPSMVSLVCHWNWRWIWNSNIASISNIYTSTVNTRHMFNNINIYIHIFKCFGWVWLQSHEDWLLHIYTRNYAINLTSKRSGVIAHCNRANNCDLISTSFPSNKLSILKKFCANCISHSYARHLLCFIYI